MAKGKIKRLVTDRGYGFIQTEEGKDLFFHQSQLQGVGYSSLKEGQEVEHEAGMGRGGRPEAAKVKLLSPSALWNFRLFSLAWPTFTTDRKREGGQVQPRFSYKGRLDHRRKM